MTEDDIIHLIKKDDWMMEILQTAEKLKLPDWWIGAGFVRSKVWDHLHSYKTRTPVPDIDVIYFNKSDFSDEEAGSESTKVEAKYQNQLKKMLPNIKWSVTNEARMHIFHNHEPYKSSTEALSYWVETATCIGVKLDDRNNLILTAPHGIDDLVNLILRPVPNSGEDIKIFNKRIADKKWLSKWPKLKVVK